MPARVLISLTALLWLLAAAPAGAETGGRVISADGSVTEIIYALGAQDRLIGVDTTSQYPPETRQLASVGYNRQLSAEGVLSLNPTLVLITKDAGPPEVLEQLHAAGTPLRIIPSEPTVAGLEEKVSAVAAALDMPGQEQVLIENIHADLAKARQALSAIEQRPRVLFLLNIGEGSDMSGGRNTAADSMIELAGGSNVMHDAFEGYKPLTAEAIVAAAPDAILLTERNLQMLDGEEGVLQRAGLAVTPAGKNKRIIAMDGLYLLGFGPRTGKAVAELSQMLHNRTE
jgi:iron complex transport system substrate-binding protein